MARNRVTIKDHTAEANLFARRTVIAMLVIFTMIAMVLSNLYYLQVTRFEDYPVSYTHLTLPTKRIV